MDLEAKQREMRARMARQSKRTKRKIARSGTPNLPRGIFVSPIRRDKRVCDWQELRELACQHLRSPRTKTSEFNELFELAVRHGLITTGTPGIHPPESKESEHQPDIHALVREVEAEMREERQKKAKEAEKQQ
jgi:hypothetical protein